MNDSATPALDAWNAKYSVPEKVTQETEHLRSSTSHNEASALDHARREGYREADEKWQVVVAEKDALIAELQARLGEGK